MHVSTHILRIVVYSPRTMRGGWEEESGDTTMLRDAVTGAPLTFGPGVMILRLPADTDERSIPPKIDRAEIYHTDEAGVTASKAYNGGLEWSGGFRRYIGGVVPVSISEARRLWNNWWELPDVVAHVRSRMEPERFHTAMLYWREYRDVHDVAMATKHSYRYVIRAKVDAKRIVRRDCLPYRLMRQELPAFAAQLAARRQQQHSVGDRTA